MSPLPTCVQEKQLGTCHAVLAARAELCGFNGDILVIFGDQPLIPNIRLKLSSTKDAKAMPWYASDSVLKTPPVTDA
ncbi:MAG: hypothetical protein ACLU99_02265 [Alphaproteobacteria bacterium]